MKTLICYFLFIPTTVLSSGNAPLQQKSEPTREIGEVSETDPEVLAISDVILAFAKAGDGHDIATLERCLDSNYAVVMNRLFGSSDISIMYREVYLEKIRSKEFGGDKREVSIENVTINGNNASAKVIMKGSKMTFVSILVLVKNANGTWQIIYDLPSIQA